MRYLHIYYLMFFLFVLSLITGIYDVLLPVLAGARPFYHLTKFLDIFGYVYLYLHIYIHNLGLACLVPSIGLIAIFYERKPRFRPVIPNILVFTSLLALYSGWFYMEMELTKHVLIIFIFETEGILITALSSYSFIQNMEIKERRTGKKIVRLGFASTIEPVIQKIAPYFLISCFILAVGAFFEVRHITGT